MERVIIKICSIKGEVLNSLALEADNRTLTRLGLQVRASDRHIAELLQNYLEKRFDTTSDF